MMNFGPLKILFTAVAALLILGPKKLPDALRSVSRALTQLRQASREVTEELKSELDLDTGAGHPAPRPPAATKPRIVPPPEELRPGPRP